jgi:hypothetical protein
MNTLDSILELIANGFDVTLKNQADTELGGRSLYLGLSDLSKSMTCQRSLV